MTRPAMTPDEIRAIRARLGMTQAEFAQALGLSRRETVAEWESGRTSPSGTAVVLMRLLARIASTHGLQELRGIAPSID